MRLVAIVLIVAATAFAMAGCGSKCGDLPGTVATVNGEAIDCSDYVNRLNTQAGRDVLASMIEQDIVMQWAKKSKVEPTQAQIDKQIALLKSEMQYEDQVKARGEEGVRNDVRNLQARINLAKKYIKVTDEDVEQAYESMKTRFVRGPRWYVAAIVNSDKAELEKAEKALKGGKDFDEVAKQYADTRVTPRPPVKVWVVKGQPGMEALVAAAEKAKVGKTTGIVELSQPGGGPSTYVILNVMKKEGAIDKKLKQVRPQVVDALVMQKSQFDADFQKKLNDKLKAAKIKIDIPQYEDVADQFKNPPEPMGMMPMPSARPN